MTATTAGPPRPATVVPAAPSTRSGERINGVDAVRGVAAMSVAVGHAWYLGGMALVDDGPLRAVLASCYLGVDVFFVISGLVLLYPVARGGALGSRRAFYRRRWARIGPLYLICLAVALLARSALYHPIPAPAVTPSVGPGVLLAHLLLVPNELFGGNTGLMGFGADSVIWTLAVEASFYLVLPFLAAWWVRRPVLGLVLGLALARAWALVGLHLGAVAGAVGVELHGTALVQAQVRWLLELPNYAGHFATGMTLAVLLARHRDSPALEVLRRRAGLIALAGLAEIVAFMWWAGSRGLAGHLQPFDHETTGWRVLPGVVLLLVGVSLRQGRVLDGRLGRFLGDTSYALYLLHLMVIEWLVLHVHLATRGSLGELLLLLAGVACTYPAAAVTFRYVEVPLRRTINTGWPRRAGATAGGTT